MQGSGFRVQGTASDSGLRSPASESARKVERAISDPRRPDRRVGRASSSLWRERDAYRECVRERESERESVCVCLRVFVCVCAKEGERETQGEKVCARES